MQFVIREYRAQDFDRLWQIDQLCFPDGIAYTQMELSGFIARRKAIILVAEAPAPVQDTGARGLNSTAARPVIAGFVVALPVRGSFGHVVTLDVVPEMRCQGLASRLMGECEARLRAAGCSLVYLETAVNNRPAQQLYAKLGYEVVRTLPDYYGSHSLDAFQMMKKLQTEK